MYIKTLSPDVGVAPQIASEYIARIKAASYRSIVCHRPDKESVGQPSHADIEEAARVAGLEFRYQPVVSGRMSHADAETFAHLITKLPKPILAYCRSGARSSALNARAQVLSNVARE